MRDELKVSKPSQPFATFVILVMHMQTHGEKAKDNFMGVSLERMKNTFTFQDLKKHFRL